jgi:hypothetical protein
MCFLNIKNVILRPTTIFIGQLSKCLLLAVLTLNFTAVAKESQVAPGPAWFPMAGATNYPSPFAACNSREFASHYLGTANTTFDHVGPNGVDNRLWCWFVIIYADDTEETHAITIVSPACPKGSELAGEFRPDGKGYACICSKDFVYVNSKRQCISATPQGRAKSTLQK